MQFLDQELLAFVIAYCRIGPWLLLLPGFANQQIPAHVRGLLGLVLSVVICQAHPRWYDPRSSSSDEIFRLVGQEAGVGIIFGLLGRCVFSFIEASGSLISVTIGLSANIGVIVGSDEHPPVFGTLMSIVALQILTMSDMHLHFVDSIDRSYVLFAPNGAFQTGLFGDHFVDTFSETFSIVFSIAAPFVLVSLVVSITQSLLAKVLPQLQLMSISNASLLVGGGLVFVLLLPFTMERLLHIMVTLLVPG